MRSLAFSLIVMITISVAAVSAASAQSSTGTATPVYTQYGELPVKDNMIFYHLILNQFEGRTNGSDNEFRWDSEGWIGTDMHRFVVKSEGFFEKGLATDGITEAFYSHPIPRLRYFDVQGGLRYDLDSDPGLLWGAIGIEGLAPQFFQFEPTFYFSDEGRVSGRINGPYDLFITERLIAQP